MVKIVAISDTHTKHKKLEIPECDVLIHAGDFTWTGKYWEVNRFLMWMEKQPAKHKIVVAGNHEMSLDKTHEKFYPPTANLMHVYRERITYLENSAVEIDGIKFYGTPWTPWFHDWGFNGVEGADAPFRRHENAMLSDIYGEIPMDTNVLICHGPPYDLVDKATDDHRCGSVEMRKIIEDPNRIDLRLYICGHIHEARGRDTTGGVEVCNVSSLARDYETIGPPVVIEVDNQGFVESIQGYEE